MGICQLACWKTYVREEAPTAYAPPPVRGLPPIDLMRANPAGYLLSRILAPGSACKPTAAWVAPSVGRHLKLGDGVHCETRAKSADAAGKRCIILFHGNSADAASTLDGYANLRAYGDLIAVNAPGYGQTPPPNNHRQLEWQMACNLQAVIAHVAQSYAPKDVLWLGFSLGSAQAAMGFQSMPGSHLLLDAPFTSVRALVDKHIGAFIGTRCDGWLSGVLAGCSMAALPIGWHVPGSAFCTDGLNTEAKLRHCAATHRPAGSRLAIIFAEHDEIMDRAMPQQLWCAYNGAESPVDPEVVYCLRGVGHNGPQSPDPKAHAQARHNHVCAAQLSAAKLFGVACALP